jgi:pimeloyl-ACP methyl ester carboxylesterase
MNHRRIMLVLTCFYLALFDMAHAQGLRFTTSIRTTNGVSLQWSNSIAGQSYTVQSRDRLTNSIWLMLGSPQPWPTVQTQWNDTTLSTQLMRFYRVAAVQPATRGKLLSSNLLHSYTVSDLNTLLYNYGLPPVAQYEVKWYQVVYETIDPVGGRTTASGGLFLPQGVGRSLPLFSYSHGTTTYTNDVASIYNSGEYPVGLVFASTGYATVLPDYLGMGSSPGFHPYVHARSEASAGVDMLRAARNFCASNSVGLNGQLFLAGYSQGGHAAMALHRELEQYHTNEFTITASAPMAGPYDMSGVELNDLLSSRCPPNPYYYAYILVAYQSVYALASGWTELLLAPYNSTLPPLFNGNTSGGTISSYMPACNMSSMLTPALLSSLTNDPGSPVLQALRDNDLDHWKPVAPMTLYQCDGDQDVLFANLQVAYSNFVALGATQVQWSDPLPGADHGGCYLPSLEAAKTWFDSLKQ